jgi:hypothetical protein
MSPVIRGAAMALLLAAAACTSPDKRIKPFADDWGAARFPSAEQHIDALIADESDTDEKLVTESHGLDAEIKPSRGDTFLFMQEKAMTRLAAGDLDSCIDLLRRSRDELDKRNESKDLAGWLKAGLVDDTSLEYRGADYERVLVPALLAVVDLLDGAQDAFAYSIQVSEVQERILGSNFGENVDGKGSGYNPVKQYTRVAVGAYIEGLVRERDGYASEALKAYRRALEWGGETPLVKEAAERTDGKAYAQPGAGVVHVFRFAGRGPRLVQGTSMITNQALALANISSFIVGKSIGTLGQAPVPVPVVFGKNQPLPELEIRRDGALLATSSTLLDVDVVARQQLAANLPWILARAAIRRGVKAVAATAAQDAVKKNNNNDEGLGALAGILTNLILTGGENADTRNWTSLPSDFQAARFELPAGDSLLDLGGGMSAHVRVAAGKESYVLVLQPDLALPGVVIVDLYSRVPEPPPAAPAAPAAEAPAAAPSSAVP